MKKIITLALIGAIGLVGLTTVSTVYKEAEAATAGWRQDNVGWWYQNANGSYKKDEWYQNTDGQWYYFNSDGYMATNQWIDTYYVGASGKIARQHKDTIQGTQCTWVNVSDYDVACLTQAAQISISSDTEKNKISGISGKEFTGLVYNNGLPLKNGNTGAFYGGNYSITVQNYRLSEIEISSEENTSEENTSASVALLERITNEEELEVLSQVLYEGCYWDTAPASNENVIALINEIREAAGKNPIVWEQEMQDDAKIRANENASINKVTHTRPNGVGIARYKYSNGSNYGECASGSLNEWTDDTLALEQISPWLISNSHYTNGILSKRATVGAVAISDEKCDEGYYMTIFLFA